MILGDGRRIIGRGGHNTAISKAVDAALTELGVDAEWEEVKDRLAARGLTCCQETFRNHYQAMFGVTPTAHRAMVEELMNEPEESVPQKPEPADAVPRFIPPVEPADNLERLIKFACAVEIVGGVERARKYLDALEQFGKVT